MHRYINVLTTFLSSYLQKRVENNKCNRLSENLATATHEKREYALGASPSLVELVRRRTDQDLFASRGEKLS